MPEATLSPRARKGTIAAIWTGARHLGLSKAELKRLMKSWTGEPSIRASTDAQLVDVVENLRRMGFERADGELTVLRDDKPQVRKIKGLWLDLYRLDAVERPSLQALNAYVLRMTSLSHINYLDTENANRVIEALKKWRDRVSKDD